MVFFSEESEESEELKESEESKESKESKEYEIKYAPEIIKIKDNENKYNETKEILDQHFSWDAKAKEVEDIYTQAKNL